MRSITTWQHLTSSGRLFAAIAASLVVSSAALSGCASTAPNYDNRTLELDAGNAR